MKVLLIGGPQHNEVYDVKKRSINFLRVTVDGKMYEYRRCYAEINDVVCVGFIHNCDDKEAYAAIVAAYDKGLLSCD